MVFNLKTNVVFSFWFQILPLLLSLPLLLDFFPSAFLFGLFVNEAFCFGFLCLSAIRHVCFAFVSRVW